MEFKLEAIRWLCSPRRPEKENEREREEVGSVLCFTVDCPTSKSIQCLLSTHSFAQNVHKSAHSLPLPAACCHKWIESLIESMERADDAYMLMQNGFVERWRKSKFNHLNRRLLVLHFVPLLFRIQKRIATIHSICSLNENKCCRRIERERFIAISIDWAEQLISEVKYWISNWLAIQAID